MRLIKGKECSICPQCRGLDIDAATGSLGHWARLDAVISGTDHESTSIVNMMIPTQLKAAQGGKYRATSCQGARVSLWSTRGTQRAHVD